VVLFLFAIEVFNYLVLK